MNLNSVEKAQEYHETQKLLGRAMHGAGRPPPAYQVRFIPHKMVIKPDGLVYKNFYDVSLPEDIDALLNPSDK